MNGRVVYSVASVALASVVGVLAAGMAGADARAGVVAGAATAVVFQLLVFWAVTGLFPGRPVLAFGVGMLGRFALVAVMALGVVPVTGLNPASTLLTLVAVLFATTLLEPVFLRPAHGTGIDDR